MRLGDVMSTKVYTVTEDAVITTVAKAMVAGRFGAAVVVSDTAVAGIFTERDAMRAVAEGSDPGASTVSEWMTRDPVTAAPQETADEAAARMIDGGFRHLPVVDDGRVVGIVSLRDVLDVRVAGD